MTQAFVPGYGPAIPAPAAGGGVTVQDTFGNVVAGVTVLTVLPPAQVGPGAPGEAQTQAFNPPVVGVQDLFAVYANPSGDLAYSAGLRFKGGTGPRFFEPGAGYALDESVGYAVLTFDPPVATPGPPFFGAGNGFVWKGQDAAPGSGLSGGDGGVQGGNSDAGATGGTAFIQPGTSPAAVDHGESQMRNATGAARVRCGGATDGVAFHGTAPIAKPTVLGARGGNAALTSLLTVLASYGLIIDGTTP